MQADMTAAKAARAVRGSKYRCRGVIHGKRRELPPTEADRRYAAAAVASALYDLADETARSGRFSSGALIQLAQAIELGA